MELLDLPLEILLLILNYFVDSQFDIIYQLDLRLVSKTFSWALTRSIDPRLELFAHLDPIPCTTITTFTLKIKTKISQERGSHEIDATGLLDCEQNGLKFWFNEGTLDYVSFRTFMPRGMDHKLVFFSLVYMLNVLENDLLIHSFKTLNLPFQLRPTNPEFISIIKRINKSPLKFSATIDIDISDELSIRNTGIFDGKTNEIFLNLNRKDCSFFQWPFLSSEQTKIDKIVLLKGRMNAASLSRLVDNFKPHLKKLILYEVAVNYGNNWLNRSLGFDPPEVEQLELMHSVINYKGSEDMYPDDEEGQEDIIPSSLVSWPLKKLQVFPHLLGNDGTLGYLKSFKLPNIEQLEVELPSIASSTLGFSHMLLPVKHLKISFATWKQLDLLTTNAFYSSHTQYLELVCADRELTIPP